ncbi:hypothetical protein LAJ19_20805 (plasmid) [Deinococcus taeanensis]|uniref:hypothetical protein n=1 Tax=Deinococcus taeanensis TaxID=2737050 RepID=UPI001CDB53B1|nr:hypothetical protein [Deinococcus taeanensis]UBV45497.1 hypothetical protein LAJ19_20805 [Deinococcus taeanensis]
MSDQTDRLPTVFQDGEVLLAREFRAPGEEGFEVDQKLRAAVEDAGMVEPHPAALQGVEKGAALNGVDRSSAEPGRDVPGGV